MREREEGKKEGKERKKQIRGSSEMRKYLSECEWAYLHSCLCEILLCE